MKFKKSLLSAGVLALGLSGQASAAGFYFDLAAIGLGDTYVGSPMETFLGEDSDTVTDVTTGFTTAAATLTSVYWDTDFSGDINSGDAVTDEVSGLTVVDLFGLAGDVTSEYHGNGVGSTWQLSIDWSFSGTGFVGDLAGTGDTLYVGAFDEGSALVTLEDKVNNVTYDVMSMTMRDFDNALKVNNDNSVTGVIDVAWDVSEVFLDDFIFAKSGADFFEIANDGDDATNISFTASTEINGLDNAPTLQGTDTFDGTPGVSYFERTTDGQSTDWAMVPEPGSLAIFGATLLALAGLRRRS